MNDIEDLYQTSSDTLIPFVKDLVQTHLNSENDYLKKYNELKVKYKLCPSKTKLRKVYNELLSQDLIKPNDSFLEYSLKRKCRSSSGVTVISI